MKEEPLHPWIEPELEARIVALVLGEASDFEHEELERLIEERSELAMLKKRIETVNGLLREVATGESALDDGDWKLSDEKRSAVLAVIDGEVKAKPVKQLAEKTVTKQAANRGKLLGNIVRFAAVLFIVAIIAGSMMPSFKKVMPKSKLAAMEYARRSAYLAESTTDTASSSPRPPTADAAQVAKRDPQAKSQSSLSAIRGNLGRYSEIAGEDANGQDTTTRTPAGKPVSAGQPIALYVTSNSATAAPEHSESEVLDVTLNGANKKLAQTHKLSARSAGSERLTFPSENDAPADPFASAPAKPARATASRLPSVKSHELDQLVAGVGGGVGGSAKRMEDLSDVENRYDLQSRASDKNAVRRNQMTGKDRPEIEGQAQRAGTTIASGAFGTEVTSEKLNQIGLKSESTKSRELVEKETFMLKEQIKMPTKGKKPSGALLADAFADTASPNSPPAPVSIAAPKSLNRNLDRKKLKSADEEMEKSADSNYAGLTAQVGNRSNQSGFPRQVEAGRESPKPTGVIPQSGIVSSVPVATVNQTSAGSSITREIRFRADERGASDSLTAGTAVVKIDRDDLPSTKEDKVIAKRLAKTERTTASGFASNVVGGKYFLKTKEAVKKNLPSAGLNEKNAEEESFSTFSLHVSDVSFKLAQAALAKGEWPEAEKIRIEEFVNALDYGDPMPNQDEKVACRLEQAIHPFLQQRNLMRVSMRTAAEGRSGDTPLRLTFLLDNSGSMERADRQQTVQRAFALLAQQLQPMDQVTLISFARQPRLLADKVSGAKSNQLVQLVSNIPSEGGTNLEAALQLAFEKAREQQIDNAQNRIIMLTDGAANLGDAKPETLAKMIETMRDAGIAFDAAGIGADGLNDEILEALTRKGDGRYYLLDGPEDADDGFARQIAGALRPAAKNVKVQIEFNPDRVGKYKLLGFEKHRLKKEDFRNDKVDAAEMAAAEAGVAVYQFEAKADGKGDVGSVSVRFRDMSTGQMVENRWPIPYEADAPRIDQAEPSLRIATSASLLGAKLKGGPLGGSVDLKTLSNLIAGLPDRQRNSKRVQQLQQMINQARQVSGN